MISENHVYLFPFGDRAYHSAIAPAPPTPQAIFLTEEGSYPTEVWWQRHDLNLDSIWCSQQVNGPQELVDLLDFLGECGHVIDSLWDHRDIYCGDAALLDLFETCYCRKMEEWMLASEDL